MKTRLFSEDELSDAERGKTYNRLGNGKGRPVIDCGAALRAQMRSGSMNLD